MHFFDESVDRFADRVAFASLGSELRYDALGRKTHAFASYLQQIGVRHGERVALMMPNTLAYPVALFGAFAAGAIVVNVNPLYTVRELTHQLKDCGAQTIVVFDAFAKTLQDALPNTRVCNVIVTSLGDLFGEGVNLKGRAVDFVLRHVRRQVPAYALPNAVALRNALAQGRAGADRAQRHRVHSVHRRHHRRAEGRDAHASQRQRACFRRLRGPATILPKAARSS